MLVDLQNTIFGILLFSCPSGTAEQNVNDKLIHSCFVPVRFVPDFIVPAAIAPDPHPRSHKSLLKKNVAKIFSSVYFILADWSSANLVSTDGAFLYSQFYLFIHLSRSQIQCFDLRRFFQILKGFFGSLDCM